METNKLEDTLHSIINNVSTLDWVVDFYLYGSTAQGRRHVDSDVDLLILGTKPKTLETLVELSKLLSYTPIEIDVKYSTIDDYNKQKNTNKFYLNIQKDLRKVDDVLNELLSFRS